MLCAVTLLQSTLLGLWCVVLGLLSSFLLLVRVLFLVEQHLEAVGACFDLREVPATDLEAHTSFGALKGSLLESY